MLVILNLENLLVINGIDPSSIVRRNTYSRLQTLSICFVELIVEIMVYDYNGIYGQANQRYVIFKC